MKSKSKGISMAALLGMTLILAGCTSNQNTGSMGYEEETGTNGVIQEIDVTEEAVDLSGINPDAAQEIRDILQAIRENISADAQVGDVEVIKQGTSIMSLATGNSLVEPQVELVIKDWKQKLGEDELEEFKTRFALVYEEYGILTGEEAQAELQKANLSINDYDFCGNGALDMVEWIHTYLE